MRAKHPCLTTDSLSEIPILFTFAHLPHADNRTLLFRTQDFRHPANSPISIQLHIRSVTTRTCQSSLLKVHRVSLPDHTQHVSHPATGTLHL